MPGTESLALAERPSVFALGVLLRNSEDREQTCLFIRLPGTAGPTPLPLPFLPGYSIQATGQDKTGDPCVSIWQLARGPQCGPHSPSMQHLLSPGCWASAGVAWLPSRGAAAGSFWKEFAFSLRSHQGGVLPTPSAWASGHGQDLSGDGDFILFSVVFVTHMPSSVLSSPPTR